MLLGFDHSDDERIDNVLLFIRLFSGPNVFNPNGSLSQRKVFSLVGLKERAFGKTKKENSLYSLCRPFVMREVKRIPRLFSSSGQPRSNRLGQNADYHREKAVKTNFGNDAEGGI